MSPRRHDPNPSPPTRRDFLAHTALAAGALAAGSAAARGQDAKRPLPKAPDKDPLAENEPIRMAIIGTGGMGGGHLNSIIRLAKQGKENVQIVALAEVCKPRLDGAIKRASERQGISVEGYRDYQQLLARDDVHCVLIASPEHWHAKMAVDAIAAGKDVYVEKPMTLRLDQALWLKKVMEKNPHMRLQVGTQYIMRPKYREARKLIAAGAVGHPTFSQTSYCRNSKRGEWLYYKIDPKVVPGEMLDWERWLGHLGPRDFDTEIYHRWRRYKDFSTGIIGDLLVHMMTPLIYSLDAGWPVRVTATGGHYIDKKMENHDQVNLTVQFEKEHTMIVAGSTCNEQGLETMVRGHKGNILLGSNNCVMRPERIFADEIEPKTVKIKGVPEHDLIRLDWLHSVRTREMNASPVDLGVKVMVIVDLATRSMWEGPAFAFDPMTQKASPVT